MQLPRLDTEAPRTLYASGVNFAAVLLGLALIVWRATGDDEIALLNLWSTWGLFLGLFGQMGLVSGVLDDRKWHNPSVLGAAAALLILGGVAAGLLRNSVFPTHERWWIAVGVIASCTYLIGRQRAVLTNAKRGFVALWIAAGENVIRALTLGCVLVAGRPDLAVFAIVGPFVVSLLWLSKHGGEAVGEIGPRERLSGVAAPIAILAGLPALLAFAMVPLLTILDRTARLEELAIAVTLARGPLVVAGFVSPLILERSGSGPDRRMPVVALVVVAVCAHAVWLLLAPTGIDLRLLGSAATTSIAVGGTYLLVLIAAPLLARSSTPPVAIAGAVLLFAGTVVASGDASGASGLSSLAGACLFITLVLAADIGSSGRMHARVAPLGIRQSADDDEAKERAA